MPTNFDVSEVHADAMEVAVACSIDAGLVHGRGDDQEDEPFFKTVDAYDDRAGQARLRYGTEDIYFSDKLCKAGGKIMVDTGVLAGHIDKHSGIVYGLSLDHGPAGRAKWLPGVDGQRRDEKEAAEKGLKLAIDLGAGGERRHWEGHVTYTL